MTRILLLLSAFLLAGCGGSPGDDRTIVYNCAANTAEIAALRPAQEKFFAQTGIRVKLNPFSGEEKLYAMMAAGQAPDVFYTNNAVRDRLAAEGRLLDLRPYVENDPVWSRLRPEVRDAAVSADGGIYSLGNYTQTAGVYYNRAAFAEAGLTPPTADWTWADFKAAAQALTKDANGDGKPERYGVFIPAHFIETLALMNHAPVPRDALFLKISPEEREVYAEYLGLMRDGVMPDLRRVQAMGMQAAQMLEAGRVAMLVESVPHPGLAETLTIDWAVAPLPRFGDKTPRYFRSASGGLSISATTKNPADAWRTLVWLISEAAPYQPSPMLNDVPFIAAQEEKYPQLKGRGFREVWALSEQFPGGDPRYFVRFASWSMGPVMTRFQPWLDRLWSGDATIDAVTAAVPEINAGVRADLKRQLQSGGLQPAWKTQLEQALAEQP
ncbi:MAG: extracellular solute-binding protein [Opitutaceae bacterium]|nr:extracellular solute-binding protein [Cephaloticoccus sp.]MCP5531386.1 extracellular solute-binding protein [Opitutaceae bacterium]